MPPCATPPIAHAPIARGRTHGLAPPTFARAFDRAFGAAQLDLSPKDAQQIKAAILNLEKEDNAEEEEEL